MNLEARLSTKEIEIKELVQKTQKQSRKMKEELEHERLLREKLDEKEEQVCKDCTINLIVMFRQLSLTLSAHAREGYSSHFVCQSVCLSVCVSLFHSGEGAVFRVETYISIHSR